MVANVIMNIIKKILCDSIDKLLTALGAHDSWLWERQEIYPCWHEAFSCRENEGILSFLNGAHHKIMTQNDVEAADWYDKILK